MEGPGKRPHVGATEEGTEAGGCAAELGAALRILDLMFSAATLLFPSAVAEGRDMLM